MGGHVCYEAVTRQLRAVRCNLALDVAAHDGALSNAAGFLALASKLPDSSRQIPCLRLRECHAKALINKCDLAL